MKRTNNTRKYAVYAFALAGVVFIAAKLYEKITKKKLAWL